MTELVYKQTRTTLLIEARLAEAARTLRRMPDKDSRYRQLVRALWPGVKPEKFDDWIGYNRFRATVRPSPPSAGAIDRMDEILFIWLPWLHPDQMPGRNAPQDLGAIVFARANRFSWRAIMRMRGHRAYAMGGNSHVSLRKAYRLGIAAIEKRLESQGRELQLPDDMEG